MSQNENGRLSSPWGKGLGFEFHPVAAYDHLLFFAASLRRRIRPFFLAWFLLRLIFGDFLLSFLPIFPPVISGQYCCPRAGKQVPKDRPERTAGRFL